MSTRSHSPSLLFRTIGGMLSFLLLGLPWCHAAFERALLVPPIAARGGTGVGRSEGKAAFLWNPAAKGLSRALLFTAYSQPYNIDDLAEGILGYSHTLNQGSLGISWQRFRTTGYHEDRQSVAISYGNRKGRAGVRLDRFGIAIDGFGHRSRLGVSIGGLWAVTANLRIGIAFDSLNRPNVSTPLPRQMALGIGVQATPDLQLCVDFRDAADVEAQILAGGEFSLGQHLVLRGGMHNHPWEVTTGWGLQIASLALDYAWVNHPNLNGTHQIAISWVFKKGE